MSTTYLGNRFDIHGGGSDLVFPHHESEIAQAEGASGERPFVTWWMHTGMLGVSGSKMSKSLGNLVLVRDLLRSYPGDAIRHYLVTHHYRQEVDFDEADLEASALAAARLRRACLVAEQIEPLAPAMADPSKLVPVVAERRERFLAAMNDDLDTPAALPELHALAALCQSREDPQVITQAGWMIRELGARILGLRLATVPAARPSAVEPLAASA
jgi:cysteinyl-tRNA synthetase